MLLFARANLVYLVRNVGWQPESVFTVALSLDAGAGRGRTGVDAGHGVRAVRTINTTKSATAARRTALPIRRPFGIG